MVRSATPQEIVQSETAKHTAVLVLGGVPALRSLRERIRELPALASGVAAIDPSARVQCAVAIGATLWSALSPSSAPRGLRSFETIRGRSTVIPALQGDLLLMVQSERFDLNFELLLRARRSLGGSARIVEEVQGFRYLDSRDLSGFIDGTGNPEPEEREDAVVVGAEDPGFEGGSYMLAQRWVHDLDAMRRLAVPEREKVFGRTLAESVELEDDVKPIDAHIARVEIVEDGKELAIYRKSFPYGTTSEHGLYFAAFARDPATFEKMMRRMLGIGEDGRQDRVFGFTRAVSGGIYFVPSRERLAAL